jgi:hypothetical protein
MELLILADWPDQGVFRRPADLPKDLVEFARDRHGNAPKPPSLLGSIALSYLPKTWQIRVFQHVAGQSTANTAKE